jgi:hypothetical protein
MRPLFGFATALGISVAVAAAQENLDKQKLNVQVEVNQMLKGAKILGIEAGIMGPAVKNAPYQADEIHETTQTLADGTRIHNEIKTTVYRDSQGRVRRESPGQVMIWDASSGTSYMLNQSNQTAQKMQMAVNYMVQHKSSSTPTTTTMDVAPAEGPNVRFFRFPADGSMPAPDGQHTIVFRATGGPAEGKKETLGAQIIEGVNCDGTRTTNTLEAGVIGNDRPIQSIEERWYSPDLQVAVTVKRTDPRTGEDTVRLTNIRRIEPDPSLFTVPPTYQIK